LQRATDKRWLVLGITSVGVFMSSLDMFIVNIAFPEIAGDFAGSTFGELSWILNAYAIVFAALLVPAGRVADRIGRKRVFLAGLTLFALSSAACAAAPSVPALVTSRVFQAAGGALMLPATLGLILPAFPAEQRTLAVSIWSAVAGVAAALGPPIGGLLVEASWRWIFIVNVPIAAVTIAAAVVMLDEIRDPNRGARPDGIGALLVIGAVGLLTTGIVQGPDWGWGDPRVVASFATSLALGVAFVARSARHPAPVIELPLLRVRSFATANTATIAFFAGFAAMLLSGVLLLTEVWGYSSLEAGFALIPGPSMAALFAAVSTKLSSRIGLPRTAALGGLALAGSFAWLLPQVNSTPEYVGVFLPGFMFGGVGVGLLVSTLPAMVTASLPPERLATGTGVFGMSRQLGSAIGVAILIALLADPAPGELLDGIKRGWLFVAGTGIATTAISLAIGPISRPSNSPVDEGVAAAPATSTTS
jgi:EmrB/QacA subfamily drug resistance transporter